MRLLPKRSAVEMLAISITSHLPVHAPRRWVLLALKAKIARSATLYHGFQVRRPSRLVIGERASIGENAILDARGGLRIGDDVNFSSAVHVWTAQHGWNSPDFAYLESAVSIGDRAWIGPRVTILPGTSVGTGAVLAAGCVAKGEIPDFSLVAGIPGRVIGTRTRDLEYQLPGCKDKLWWW